MKTRSKSSTFHHDLLHATEHTVVINGRKTKVIVGKMHLVPTAVNEAVSHQGTASVAKKFYAGLATDVSAIKAMARKEALSAGIAGTEVAKAIPRIKPGKVAKGLS